MFDHLPPDLPRLRTLETWLTLTLDEVRKAIAAREREAAQAHRTPPTPPDWVISTMSSGRGPLPQGIHTGDCRMAPGNRRPVTREQALHALTEGVPACEFCRPDIKLGWLE